MREYTGPKARRGFKLDSTVARLAMQIERKLWNQWTDHLQDIEEWYATGDGKHKGYTYPACEHGTSRWTDYDNICGPCEDGFSMGNGFDRRRVALSEAKRRMARIAVLMEAQQLMRRYNLEYDVKAYNKMITDAVDVDHYFS